MSHPNPAATLPDLCRAAVDLLDRYAVARETALRVVAIGTLAHESKREICYVRPLIAHQLLAVSEAMPENAPFERWAARADLVFEVGEIDAEVWGAELLALAAETPDGARTTEPPPEGGEVGQ